jgi:hypothetical protein
VITLVFNNSDNAFCRVENAPSLSAAEKRARKWLKAQAREEGHWKHKINIGRRSGMENGEIYSASLQCWDSKTRDFTAGSDSGVIITRHTCSS